jgi:signal transduction histidine kinase
MAAPRGGRIIVIGGDLRALAKAVTALRRSGWDIVEAHSLEEAAALRQSNADLVVADLATTDLQRLAEAVASKAAETSSAIDAPGEGLSGPALRKAAHDLRTPLNAILGWAQLLKFGELDEATKQEALDVIERSAQAQAEMITKMLDTEAR